MALFDSYNESESPYVRVGDGGFIGMDYRTAPDKLKEGVYSYGENVRTRTKEAVTRPGNPYINWFYPDNYPWDINYTNTALTGTWTRRVKFTLSGGSGVMTLGETVTGSSSGFTAVVGLVTSITKIDVALTGNNFIIGETITGTTSTETAVITVITDSVSGDVTLDEDITVDSGATAGTPFADGYDHIRFESGLVLKATAEESTGIIAVESQFVANGQSVAAETFVWCKQVTSDENQYKDLTRSVITNATPTQTVITTGLFRDPNSKDYAVIVTDTSTWFGSEYSRPFEVTIPGGVDNNAYLLQAFDRLLLFRGTGQPVLEYTNASGVWSSITGVDSVGYTLPIPNADRAVFFQNRIWLHVNDNVYFSDIGNYTHYYWLENEVRINSGENDKIVALFPYGKHSLLVFKENGIYLLDNLYGDVAEKMRVRQISSRIGCGAPETITNAASQVWFCDKSGDVWSLSQVDEERMELSGEPVSWPISSYWDKKAARNVSTWMAAYHDSYFYLFIDTENSAWNLDTYLIDALGLPNYDNLNRVAVYDTINESWASLDFDHSLNAIGKPMLLDWLEKPRLMVVDKATGNLRVIGYGELDGTRPEGSAIYSGDPWAELLTRGYLAARGTEQQFSQLRLQVGRYNNDMQVDGLIDGINETEYFISEHINSSNRLTYLNANESTGYADWEPDNSNGDFNAPYRKDYAVYPSDNSTGINLGDTGIETNLFQAYKYVQKINELGNYMQIKCISDAGRFKVKSISIDIRSNMNLQGERV